MREMDLILGRFADDQVARLPPEELDDLERLMEVPDCDLLAWVMAFAACALLTWKPLLHPMMLIGGGAVVFVALRPLIG